MNQENPIARLEAANLRAAFNQWLGLRVVSAEPGAVELEAPWRPEIGQYSGFMHAGVVGAMLDTACGFAAVTVVDTVVASQNQVLFYAPAAGERFVAKGRVDKTGKRQVFASAELWAFKEGQGKIVAAGSAVLLVT